MTRRTTKKIVATNKEAYYNYSISERVEAGIQLTGAEVKAIRSGRLNLAGGYVSFRNGEAFVTGMHVSQYGKTAEGHNPTRIRKLLLKRAQIRYLKAQTSQKGISVIPLSLYLKNNLIKLEIGVGRGKKKHDKRARLKERQDKKRVAQELKEAF